MQKSPVTSSVALSSLENETVMPNREKSTYKIKGKLPATLWVKVQKNNTHLLMVVLVRFFWRALLVYAQVADSLRPGQ